MSFNDLRRKKSISSLSEEMSSNMKLMKMRSESDLSSPKSDAVQSLRPRTKSLTLDTRNSDSLSSDSDHSKKLQDSDSLSLKLSSSLNSDEFTRNEKGRDYYNNTPNDSQMDTQMVQTSDTFILDAGRDRGSHNPFSSTSDTVLLDLNENEAKMGNEKHGLKKNSLKLLSYNETHTTGLFSSGRNSKFNDVPDSLEIPKLKKFQFTKNQYRDRDDLHTTLRTNEKARQFIKVHEIGSKLPQRKVVPCPREFQQAIIKTPEKTFVPETQSSENSPEEIPKSPDPPAKRRKKKVSQLVSVEKGECPLCGRGMKMKVLEEHAAHCNGSDRSSLSRLAFLNSAFPSDVLMIFSGVQRRKGGRFYAKGNFP